MLVLLHVHNHLKIVQFLSPPQIIHCINKRLLTHRHDLLANVLYDVVFQLLVFVFLLLFVFIFITIIFLLSIRFSELPKELLILLMNAILLFLDGLYNLALSFKVARTSVAVARNFVRRVVPYPLYLRHMYPGLGLRLYLYRLTLGVYVCGTAYVLSRSHWATIEMLSTSQT